MNAHVERIREIACLDGRYSPDGFLFVSEVIGHTVQWIRDGELTPADKSDSRGTGEEFHVSGQELLLGLERYGRERWGLMAPAVLRAWGIRRTEDIGEIVFMMVEDPVLQWRKRECDTREDFAGGFDFEEAWSHWDEEPDAG